MSGVFTCSAIFIGLLMIGIVLGFFILIKVSRRLEAINKQEGVPHKLF
jgi:hypothetical protein